MKACVPSPLTLPPPALAQPIPNAPGVPRSEGYTLVIRGGLQGIGVSSLIIR